MTWPQRKGHETGGRCMGGSVNSLTLGTSNLHIKQSSNSHPTGPDILASFTVAIQNSILDTQKLLEHSSFMYEAFQNTSNAPSDLHICIEKP